MIVGEVTLSGPFSLFLDLHEANYWELISEIAELCKSENVSTLIKVGLMIGPSGRRSSIAMSKYRDDIGRTIASETHNTLPGEQRRLLQLLFDELTLVDEVKRPSARGFLRWECMSFSSIPDDAAARIVDLCRSKGALVSAWRWTLFDSHAGQLLWTQLILTKIITDGVILTSYEEFPSDAHEVDDRLEWTPDRSPERADGFFVEAGDRIYAEPALAHLQLPPDLEPLERVHPPATPLQRAVAAVGSETVLRRSSNDHKSSLAAYRLPYLSHHYPDLLATEAKVRNYCLNTAHPKQKWKGFEYYGWGWHASDSLVVAANICGALLGQFKPEEATVTSEGAVQFSVGVLLPSAPHVRAPLTTAWIAEPEKSFRLTSAYIFGDRNEYADVPRVVAPAADIVDVWDELMVMTAKLADSWDGDAVRTRPRIFIPRTGQSNALARRLVRDGESHGDFSRSALGGRSILVPLGPEMSWSSSAAVGSFVQIQLGLHGVRSLVDIWVD